MWFGQCARGFCAQGNRVCSLPKPSVFGGPAHSVDIKWQDIQARRGWVGPAKPSAGRGDRRVLALAGNAEVVAIPTIEPGP